MIWRDALRGVARGAVRTRAGASLGRAAYGVALDVGADLLIAAPGVQSVYVTGSMARPAAAEPGYSDIDLVALVEVPTLDSELTLRRELARWQRRLRFAGPLFGNLDYIEARDLPALRERGGAWTLDLDRRFRLVRGVDRLRAARPRPAEERQPLLLMKALRRWFKASAQLLAAPPAAPPARRSARRLLSDVLAALLDGDRLSGLSALLEGAANAGYSVPEVLLDAQGLSEASTDALLALALELLGTLCARLTREWHAPSPPPAGSYQPRLEPLDRVTAERAIESGFTSCHALARDCAGVDQTMIALADAEMKEEEIIAATRRLYGRSAPLSPHRFSWLSRPVPVSARLWLACHLFDDFPAAGDSLVHAGALIAGQAPALPPAPPAHVMSTLLDARETLVRWRPRGAAFHLSRSPAYARGKALREVDLVAPALVERRETGSTRFRLVADTSFDPTSIALVGDAGWLRRLRAWLDARRVEQAR